LTRASIHHPFVPCVDHSALVPMYHIGYGSFESILVSPGWYVASQNAPVHASSWSFCFTGVLK
jgi:hypothetical protein